MWVLNKIIETTKLLKNMDYYIICLFNTEMTHCIQFEMMK